jgi:hypothetical protein
MPCVTVKPFKESPEVWRLSHLLIPQHSKIRLSFRELQDVALDIVTTAWGAIEASLAREQASPLLSYESFIRRSHQYLEELLTDRGVSSVNSVRRIPATVPMPRYVGVVRLVSSAFGAIDVLVDTTSTKQNLNILAVFVRKSTRRLSSAIAGALAKLCECPLLK